MAKMLHFYSKQVDHAILKDFDFQMELRELLGASSLKSSKKTGWLQISMWSVTAVDFFDLDRLFVKGEIPECSPTLTLK